MEFISDRFSNIALKNFLILSRKQLKEYNWDKKKKYGVISISKPGEEPSWLKLEDYIFGIIKLGFYDVEETFDVEIFAMSDDDAEAIIDFCNIIMPSVDILIVQCDAGISRSAGVGAAISKYYFGDDQWVFNTKRPNMHCYTTVLKKFYEKENR